MTLLKVTVSSIVMAVAAVAIQHAMDRVALGTRLIPQTIRLGATIGGSVAALAVMANIPGVEAFHDAAEMVQARVRKWLGK